VLPPSIGCVDLYLVRHAIAEPRDHTRWPDDALRPVSTSGAESFRSAARGLLRLGVRVDAVLSSSYARAWRTAEILAEEAGWPAPEPSAELEPPATGQACVASIGRRSEPTVALVGHEPNLSELASLLLVGEDGAARIEFKKGGVMCLRFQGPPASGTGLLRWSAGPKLLRLLAKPS
jgi:phosphohistidine phosphatase